MSKLDEADESTMADVEISPSSLNLVVDEYDRHILASASSCKNQDSSSKTHITKAKQVKNCNQTTISATKPSFMAFGSKFGKKYSANSSSSMVFPPKGNSNSKATPRSSVKGTSLQFSFLLIPPLPSLISCLILIFRRLGLDDVDLLSFPY